MNRAGISLLLFVSIAGGALAAACGGPPAQAPENVATATPPTAPPTSPVTETPTATPTASASPTASATGSTTPPAKGAMNSPTPTAMSDKLKAIGVDVKKLPPLTKLDPPKLRKVMELFNESLGVECTDCHTKGDFKAATRRKNIAGHMWDDFVRAMATDKGQPIFCDSCHAGHVTILDRTDKVALAKWMDKSFQEKLSMKSGKDDVSCATCHGDDTAPPFLDAWGKEWKGAAK